MKRLWLTLVLITLAAAPALADDRELASKHARRAVALYEMGRFEGALVEFEAAFLLYPTDTLLFNLAQTHRRLEHCREAVELYQRLLDRSPDSDRAPAVRRLLPSLEQACKVRDVAPREVQPQMGEGASPDESPRRPPPAQTLVPAAATVTASATAAPAGEADDGGDTGEEVTAAVAAKTGSAARVYAGLTAGGLASGASVTPLGLTAGATLRTERVPVELGGQLSAAAFSWAGGGYRGTSSAVGVLVTAGKGSRRGSLDLRLDVGAGVTVLSGLATGHPLLARGRRVPGGTTTVPQLELIASGERALGSGWAAIAGIRAGAARGGDTFGGALLSFAALVGIGHAL